MWSLARTWVVGSTLLHPLLVATCWELGHVGAERLVVGVDSTGQFSVAVDVTAAESIPLIRRISMWLSRRPAPLTQR